MPNLNLLLNQQHLHYLVPHIVVIVIVHVGMQLSSHAVACRLTPISKQSIHTYIRFESI